MKVDVFIEDKIEGKDIYVTDNPIAVELIKEIGKPVDDKELAGRYLIRREDLQKMLRLGDPRAEVAKTLLEYMDFDEEIFVLD